MQTSPAFYVYPPPPIGLLVLLAAAFVIWGVVRVMNDARTWYKDEILNDYRASAKDSGKSRLAGLVAILVFLVVGWAVVRLIEFARTFY